MYVDHALVIFEQMFGEYTRKHIYVKSNTTNNKFVPQGFLKTAKWKILNYVIILFGTAYSTWGDIFECCFKLKAQSSNASFAKFQ